jgi:hypothetical protein
MSSQASCLVGSQKASKRKKKKSYRTGEVWIEI